MLFRSLFPIVFKSLIINNITLDCEEYFLFFLLLDDAQRNMKKNNFLFSVALFVIVAVLCFAGCKPMPNEGIPFYMKIDSVKLVTNYSVEGNNSQNITDVWVEANTDNLGAYELPCNFPVLQENDVRFVISAGIKESGQSGVRVNYPFYEPDTFTLVATRGNKYSHVPVFKYKAATVFSFNEDFEFGNGFTGMNKIYQPDSNVHYGSACGMLAVNPTDSNKEADAIQKYALPAGQEIWMEVDYKSEVPFWVGFVGRFSSGDVTTYPVLFVTAKDRWNKLYVKFSDAVSSVRANTYSIYFEGLNPDGNSGGSVDIDNVKLVHF